METKETAIATTESLIDTVDTEKDIPLLTAALEETKPIISAASEPAQSVGDSTPKADTLEVTNQLWEQVTQKWEEYFGEGKKSNLTITIAAIAIIPLLIAISAFLNFLNNLPLLSSVFELVGFGYSAWFIYRYLLLASTRKELTDMIDTWKNEVLG